jgi:RNA polymerase sigma-70 factor, ECF subfamily
MKRLAPTPPAASPRSAFADVYDEHAHAAFGLALRMLGDRAAAEDVVQEAFLAFWRTRGFDASRGSLRAYLLTIVRNAAVDRLRRPCRIPSPVDTVALMARLPASDPTEAQVERRAVSRVVRAALADLPEAQRHVIELSYYGGLTQAEIAARLGEPLGTIKSRMRIGLQRLRAAIEPAGA